MPTFKQYALAFAVLALAAPALAQNNNLMPQPSELTPADGRLAIDSSFRIAIQGYSEPRLAAAAERFRKRLAAQTGLPLAEGVEKDASRASLIVECKHEGPAIPSLKQDESYTLDVTSQQAHLTAAEPVGVLRGLETVLQWVSLDAQGFGLGAVHVDDKPRFAWRGLMLDVSRHWMPVEVVERNLDGMAAVKLNVFHWHLSDNQGFRVESKRFPLLQQMGSDGHYYTQEQVRHIVAYARDRGIRVVPEFDMPGHSTAMLVAYPELASAPGPYTIERQWGIFDPCLDPTNEKVYTFLDAFVGEMAGLFPDAYFHIGGDEVNGKQWRNSPRIQAFMKAHNLAKAADLQTYFSRRLVPIVEKHGKKVIGWDEVLAPGAPKTIVVQSWRGQRSLAEASSQGYNGILSAGYYLDLMQPAAQHYRVDPEHVAEARSRGAATAPAEAPVELTAEQKSHILGGEACMWSEFVTTENVDERIWPRMAAIAERLWSPESVTDVDSMYRRMEVTSRWLETTGLTHRISYPRMLDRIAGLEPSPALRTLADVVEPVKGYSREGARHYTSLLAYNRLVDSVRPESPAAREFAGWVADWQNHKEDIRRELVSWRDAGTSLSSGAPASALLAEDQPVAANLAAVATAGLAALDHLENGTPAPADWAKEQQDVVTAAAKPKAELLLMIAPSVGKLIDATQAK